MTTFKGPQYTKILNPKTGAQDPCYTFTIEFAGDYLSFVANTQSDISVETLQKCISDNVSWWNTFINKFLETSSKSFSKPYTVESINKVTKHTLNGANTIEYPVNIILIPKNIQISGGIFTVHWNYDIESMIIPDLEDLPVSNIQEMEELNIDELPAENSTEVLEIDNPNKSYDKQRVKELRLKAKLAQYKVERQMAEYCDKYGDDISDSDTEYTSEEDVQF